jgi:hypothetical protein
LFAGGGTRPNYAAKLRRASDKKSKVFGNPSGAEIRRSALIVINDHRNNIAYRNYEN